LRSVATTLAFVLLSYGCAETEPVRENEDSLARIVEAATNLEGAMQAN
jgi:hypothetical protein